MLAASRTSHSYQFVCKPSVTPAQPVTRARNPRGVGREPRWRSTRWRTAPSTDETPSTSRNPAIVGVTHAKRCGSKVAAASRARYTARTRRRMDRSAPSCPMASSASAGCTTSTAPARLPATSTATTTASTAASVPESRAAKKSGSKLTEARCVGHHQRATRIPGGATRSYDPSRRRPHPPTGWKGHSPRTTPSQALLLTYSSSESCDFHKSCTDRYEPARGQTLRAHSFCDAHRPTIRSCGTTSRCSIVPPLGHRLTLANGRVDREGAGGGSRPRARLYTCPSVPTTVRQPKSKSLV
jgi:hypothetical protein